VSTFDQQLAKIKNDKGFIAALDQSGGSTPKALKLYGVEETAWKDEKGMYDVVHAMRTRIITSPAFSGKRLIGAILFENTMDRDIEGKPTPTYLWEKKNVVPFLKVDKGLADEQDGVQLMKPIPGLDALLKKAKSKSVFGTKMRSVIKQADPHGIEKVDCLGRYEEGPVSEPALAILAEAESQLESAGVGEHLEVKLAGVALHWRGLKPAAVSKIRTKAYRILKPLAASPEIVLAEFEEGIEIRLASANKGNALRDLLSQLQDCVPIAYLGDDDTDEEAFQVLNGRGLSVLVGSKPRFTLAQIWLKTPGQLLTFLTQWIQACGAGQ